MPPDWSHANELTDASTLPRHNLTRTVVGMAHFAGTGPADAICDGCVFHRIPEGRRKPICDKYRQMTGDKAKPVPSITPACRYFERRMRA